MALQLLVIASLLSLSLGQSPSVTMSDVTTSVPTAAVSSTPTPAMSSAPTPAVTSEAPPAVVPTPSATPVPTEPPTEPSTEGPTEDPVDVANMELNVAQRYGRQQAVDLRNDHFFCPEQGAPFLTDVSFADMTTTNYIWTLFLQYPVLAYLDSTKKVALIDQIVALIQLGDVTINCNNICIGKVEHYDVSLYTESVLISIYRRDFNTSDTPTVVAINDAFRDGVDRAGQDLIQQFQGRNAIVISNDTYGRVNDNVHPGAFDGGVRFDPSKDPTLRAVILGYWPEQLSLVDFTYEVNSTLNSSITSMFAANPNPVYYGLTGGDIVFIVIATLLCSLLAFLMVFGFCIQPFFM